MINESNIEEYYNEYAYNNYYEEDEYTDEYYEAMALIERNKRVGKKQCLLVP